MSARILIVDDDRSMCDLLEAELRSRGFEVVFYLTADEAFDIMAQEEFHAVVTDLRMRGMNGLGLCTRIVENRPDIPVIVMTAFGSLETAVDTIRAGACDFITKPFNIDELVIALERALSQRNLRAEVKRLQQIVAETRRFDEILGSSSSMIEHAVALARFEEITVEDLPERIRSYRSANVLVVGDDPSELVSMEVVERRYVLRVLDAVGGNRSMAARILGYDRKTLYRRLETYGIPPGTDKADLG